MSGNTSGPIVVSLSNHVISVANRFYPSFANSSAFFASNSACDSTPLPTRPCSFSSVATISSAETGDRRRSRRWRYGGWSSCRGGGRRCGRIQRLRHARRDLLADTEADADAGAQPGQAAFVLRRQRDRLGGLELGIALHAAHHVHADALVEHGLQFFGQRDVLHVEAVQRQAVGERTSVPSWPSGPCRIRPGSRPCR